MKQIQAFIHRNRIADVIRALKGKGYNNLSIVDVKGMLDALDEKERDYSIELGVETITEVKMELICDDDCIAEAVEIIREKARTGQSNAGWIYVFDVQQSYPID
jgi:nitrogen regulatory protein P-II 1